MKSKFFKPKIRRQKKRASTININRKWLNEDELKSLVGQVKIIEKYVIALNNFDALKNISTESILKQVFLGQGGNGFVLKFIDQDNENAKNVAIKFLMNKKSYDIELKNNKIVSDVFKSVNLETHTIEYYENGEVTVNLFGKNIKLLYIAMEYVKDDLEKIICEKAKDDPILKKQYYLQIFKRLTKDLIILHQKNHIHRDIKPSNILMKGEYPILADFGLLAKHDSNHIKKGPKYWPTPEYVEPCETKDQFLDKKTDIFQLGCIFYWIVTQKYPIGFFDFNDELAQAEIGIKLTELITNMLMYEKDSRKILDF